MILPDKSVTTLYNGMSISLSFKSYFNTISSDPPSIGKDKIISLEKNN